MSKQGAVPSQEIKELIRRGCIKNGFLENVQPASIDLAVGEKIYRLPAVFLPQTSETVEEAAKFAGAAPYTFEYPLEVNTPYLVKLKEELELPDNIYGYANPKSSSGRNDLRVALVADYMHRFDSVIQKGYKGTIWAILEPKSYRIKIQPGDKLLQLRFFYSDSRLKYGELEDFFKKYSPLYGRSGPIEFERISKINDFDGGLILFVDLYEEMVGWRCIKTTKWLDFSKKNYYDPYDFFEPICRPKNSQLILRKGDFYIFYTRQSIVVPPAYALEMAPMDARNGEYRTHYAGFIDPGWGYSEDGSKKGAPLVLEIRPFEDNLLLRDRQPICKVFYERMAEIPDIIYGAAIGSHYHNQTGPRLSKHFKQLAVAV